MSFSKIGEWSGKDLFKCDDCRFQTVNIAQRDRHDAEAHPRARAPVTKILDPDGKPFESIPIGDALESDHSTVAVVVPEGLPEPVREDLAEHARNEARKEDADTLRRELREGAQQDREQDGDKSRPSWWRRDSHS